MITSPQSIGPHRAIGFNLDDFPDVSRRSIACRISVACGQDRHRYSGVFESPRAAFDDAMRRFPEAHFISVLRSPR